MNQGGICAACHNVRDLDDLLAFWPVGAPSRARFVCRPSVSQVAYGPLPCFARVVGSSAKHTIEGARAFQTVLHRAADIVAKDARQLRHGPSRGADLREYSQAVPA